MASRIPCSSRRLGPTRPIAASLSRLFSAAPDWIGGDELIRVLGNRQTFSGVTVEWPLSGLDRRRLIALSAAPMFGRQREFLGYRGFGVLGEEIEAAAVPGGEVLAELAEDHRSEPTEVVRTRDLVAGGRSGSRGPAKRKRRGAGRAESRSHANRRSRRRALRGLPRGGWKSNPRLALTEAFEPEAPARESDAKPMSRSSTSPDAPRPRRPRSLEADGLSPLRPPPRSSEADAPVAETEQPDLAERAAASEPQPTPAERSAEIYVLRHPAAPFSSNIVPIRPGALDALARETAQSFPAESVELSRSERDAFREIARALVGRAPASRDEHADERAGADSLTGTRDRRARRAADRSARRGRRRR